MIDCLFCAHAYESVFEDDVVAVVLHEDWAVRGHAMVAVKRHVENVADLTAGELQHFARVYQIAERALLAETGAERAIMMKLGIATPHLHVHIYPVAATASREQVMAVIDARTKDAYDARFVDALRNRLRLDRARSTE